MTAFSSRCRSVARACAVLSLPAAAACAAPQPLPARAAEPPATPSAVMAPAPAAPVTPPPREDEPSNQTGSAVSVVTLIAKPGLWPLDVESARQVLLALGPVTREQPAPDELSLVGGPFGALDRFSVAYSLDEQRYWVFGSAGFFLEDPDQTGLYRALEARLLQLLGTPVWTNENGDGLPTAAWDLGEEVTLSLAPSRAEGERSVKIAISDPARSAE